MNTKAAKFKNMLVALKISGFGEEEIEGEFHPVIFHSNLEIKGQYFPIQLILDDSIYAVIRVFIAAGAGIKNPSKAMMEFFNELNQQYKIFKYYISEQGDVVLDCCVAATDENFDPEILRALMELLLNHLNEEFDMIVKNISGKTK